VELKELFPPSISICAELSPEQGVVVAATVV